MNIKLDIPASFYEPEERSGYYVSSEIKKLWAVQLDLIVEFSRICEKYGIKWFMDAGTLLGAARHKGFIPWDDDVDVMLVREEYERFRRIPPEEFKYPYCLEQEEYSDETGRFCPILRMYNISTTMDHSILKRRFDAGKKMSIKYKACIPLDLWPLDKVPDDPVELEAVYKRLHALEVYPLKNFYARLIRLTDGYMPPVKKSLKNTIKSAVHLILSLVNPFLGGLKEKLTLKMAPNNRELIRQISELNYPDSSKIATAVCAISPEFITNIVWEVEDLDETIYLPFEMLNLPAPSGYDRILRHLYGDWHKFVVREGHADFFDTERPYTYYANVDDKNG